MTTKKRIFSLSLIVLALVCLLTGVLFGIPSKTQTASAARGSFTEIGEIYPGGVFDSSNLNALYQALTGTGTFESVQSTASSPRASDFFRSYNGGKNVSVKFGGMKWDAVYLTKAKNGDVILDLWRSSDELTAADRAKYNTWTDANSDQAKYPSSMYSTSNIRVNVLNAGGSASTGRTSATSYSQNSGNKYAKFTMDSVSGSLTQFIAKPSEVSYQASESDAGVMATRSGSYKDCWYPNDAYAPGSVKWYSKGSYSMDFTHANSQRVDNEQYGAWQNDYLWLPSLTEAGLQYSNADGIWNTDASLRSGGSAIGGVDPNGLGASQFYIQGACLLRTSIEYAPSMIYALDQEGNSAGVLTTSEAGVRPAMHLNLSEINRNLKVSVSHSVTNLTFNGAAEAVPGKDYTATLTPNAGYRLPDSITVKVGGSVILQGSGYSYDKNNGNITVQGSAIKGAINITASGVPITSTVTLDQANGTGGTESVQATYKSPMPKIEKVPTRPGYTFQGYYTGTDGGGEQYYDASGNPVSAKATCEFYTPLTLHAYWTANHYTIQFNSNKPAKASGTVQGNMANESRTYDEGVKALTKNTFTLTGWTFEGWSDSRSGSVVHTNEKQVQNLTADPDGTVTLYAVWKENTYTVNYDKNKPSKASHDVAGTMGRSTHAYDTASVLTRNDYSLTGWTFQGWSRSTTGAKEFDDHQNVSKLVAEEGGSITLYAVWKQNTYTIEFNQNKPVKASNEVEGSVSAQPRIYDEGERALPQNNFTLTGWTFQGWATAAGDGQPVTYRDTVSVQNLTAAPAGTFDLYAVWKQNTYIITLNPMGGTNAGTGSATYDDPLPDITIPAKYGYKFLGYFDRETDGTQYYEADGNKTLSTYNKVADKITLYAHWSPITYTIRLYNDNNFVCDIPDVVYGTLKLPTAEDLGLSRKNFDFVGWNIYAEQDWKMYSPGVVYATGLTGTQGDIIVLNASWQERPIHSLFYDANGGYSAPAAERLHEGEGTTIGKSPVREDYTFAGWSLAANSSVVRYNEGQSFAMGSGDVTLYAVWKHNPSLTYSANGGKFNYSIAVTYPAAGTEVELTDAVPVKEGYLFVGWALSEDAEEAAYFAKGTFPMPETDTVLYAVYKIGEYTVSTEVVDGYEIHMEEESPYTYQKVIHFTVTGASPKVYVNGAFTEKGPDGRYSFTVTGNTTILVADGSKHSLVYSANGGESAPTDPTAYEDNASANVSPVAPTRTGYSFQGWAEDKGATEAKYKAGEGGTVTFDGDEDIVLYAVWKANTYTVSYHDETGAEGSMDPGSYSYGTSQPLAINGFTKTGYNFVGWATEPGSSEAVFGDQAEVLNLATEEGDEIELYAVWERMKTLLLFDADGGSNGSRNFSAQYGEALPTSGLNAPTKSGYLFGGYFAAQGGQGTQYFNESMQPVGGMAENWTLTDRELTLYAYWIPTTETLEKSVDEVQEQLDSATYSLYSALQSGDEDLRDEIERLKAAYAAADALLKGQLQGEDARIEGKIDGIKSTLDGVDEAIKATIDALDKRLSKDIENLRETIGRDEANIADLQKKLTQLEADYAAADTLVRGDFAAADAKLQGNIDALDIKLTAADDVLRGMIKDLETKLDNAVSKLEASIETNREQIETNKDQLDQALKDLESAYQAADLLINNAIADLQTADSTLTQSISELKSASEEADRRLQTAIEAVEKKLTDAVSRLEASIEENKGDTEEKLAALKKAYEAADLLINNAIADLRTADSALTQSISDLESASEEADRRLQTAIEGVDTKLDKAVKDLEAAIEANEKDIEKKVSDLGSVYQTANDLISSEIEVLKSQDLELSRSIGILEATCKATDRRLQTAIETLEDKLDQAVEDLRAAIEANETDIEKKVSALEEKYETAGAVSHTQLTAKDEELDGKITALQAALEGKIDGLQTALNKTDAALKALVKQVQDNLDKAVEDLQKAIETNETDIEAKVTALDEKYQQANSVLESKMTAKDEELDGKITALQAALEGKTAALQTALSEADAALKASVKQVQDNLDKAVKDLQASIEANETDIEAKVSALDEKYQTANSVLESKMTAKDGELEGNITSLQNAVNEADEALQAAIDAVEAKLDKAVEELRASIEANETDIEAKVSALDEKYQTANSVLESKMAAKDGELEGKITALQTAMGEADTALQAAIKKVQDNLDKAVKDLQASIEANETDIEAKVSALDEKYHTANTVLESKMTAKDGELEGNITALQTAMGEADTALQAAIKQVQDNLDKAVEELQKAIDAKEADLGPKVSAMDAAYRAADALINSEIAGLQAQDSALAQSISALDSAYKAADEALWESIRQVEEKHDALQQESENTARTYMIVNIVLGGVAAALIVTLIVKVVKRKKPQQ